MKYFMPALKFKILMTILLGLIYPLVMTGMAQIIFPSLARGKFLERGGQVVGAELIGQKFEKPEYFWSRPSAIDFNPLPSGGSNLGPTSADLKKLFEERKAKLKSAHPDQQIDPPQDLLFASASGLDPHISVEAAKYQLSRVAKARHMRPEQVQKWIDVATEKRQWAILGEHAVNVLVLNLGLDREQGISTVPILRTDSAGVLSTSPPESKPESK